ncbi:peptidyl-prolyl cis-trans isomerase A-like isoform X2 [Schistocerca gregaria]|uniref:peptidyl-prolyl cis-trans isomerase A-like isoform X2 n=1 Tax=Schistocerca gregaria TaxID=7010 RepID=UPI00211F20B5|nr:peptidyl-prolyl cis-trans isomerase A-like isoform X2 [Schistocerca gregaria]
MRRQTGDEFNMLFMPPMGISAEKKWTLEKRYWAHIKHILTAEKVVDDDNREVWQYAERQTMEHARKRGKDEEAKTKENDYYFGRIRTTVAYYRREDQQTEWKRKQEIMEHMCKRPVEWTKIKEKDILFIGGPESRMTGAPQKPIPEPLVHFQLRPRCFFDLQIENDIHLGRIIFELYGDYVPKTAANFLGLCKGYNGLTYKGSFFHRIIPHLMCQGGDITEYNGSGGMTIFGEIFSKENYILKHGGLGVLSMTSISATKNSSQFNITFRELHALDGNSVVVGKVVKGINTLLKVEEFGYRTGKPRKKVIIINCGQI